MGSGRCDYRAEDQKHLVLGPPDTDGKRLERGPRGVEVDGESTPDGTVRRRFADGLGVQEIKLSSIISGLVRL